jgi:hypothetical protein
MHHGWRGFDRFHGMRTSSGALPSSIIQEIMAFHKKNNNKTKCALKVKKTFNGCVTRGSLSVIKERGKKRSSSYGVGSGVGLNSMMMMY